MNILASPADAELILPAASPINAKRISPAAKKEKEKNFEDKVFRDCTEYSRMIQEAKFAANECSVMEFVLDFFMTEMKKDDEALISSWLLPELYGHRGAKSSTHNNVVNALWLDGHINHLVNKIRTYKKVLPPKLEEEVKILSEKERGYQYKGEYLKAIFPYVPQNPFETHPNLPTLQTVIAICCHTAFWDAGGNNGREVLQTIYDFVRDGGRQGQLKASETEYVRELRTVGWVYRPEVSAQ